MRATTRNRLLLATLGGCAAAVAAWFFLTAAGTSGSEAASRGDPAAAAAPSSLPGGVSLPGARGATLAGRPAGEDAAPVAETPSWADAPFRGVVEDDTGKPLAGAIVRVTDADDVAPTTTDADGRFAFAPAGEDGDRGSLECRASTATHVQGIDDVTVERGTEARIRLLPACALRVIVLDAATKRPVAGAKVEAFEDAWASLFEAPALADARTDEAGRASLPVVGGEFRVVATAEGYAPAASPSVLVASTGADATIALGRGGRVEGIVRLPDGRPAAAADVRVDAYPRSRTRVTTGPDGRFAADVVPCAPKDDAMWEPRLVVRARVPDGSLPHACRIEDPPAEGGIARVEILLPSWRSIPGSVRRADGTPVAGAEVTAQLRDWNDPHRDCDLGEESVARSAAAGTFVLDRVPPGLLEVTVALAGVRAQSLASGNAERLDLVFGSGAGVASARVVEADGAPVPGVRVMAVVGTDRDGWPTSTTDAEGRASLAGAPVEGFRLVAEAPDGRVTDASVAASRSGDGEHVLRFGSGVVEGRVVRLDGSPARATVRLSRVIALGESLRKDWFAAGTREADPEGRFRFDTLTDGEHSLGIYGSDHVLVGDDPQVVAGDRDVRLVVATLAEAASLRIEATLVDETTRAPVLDLEDAEFRVVDPRSADPLECVSWSDTVVGSPGLLRSDVVPPGTYDLVVDVKGHPHIRVPNVRVAPTGGPTRVTIPIPRR